MPLDQTYRAGAPIEDHCRACKSDRMHTVMAVDAENRPVRVVCDWCRSEHNYRGGPRVAVSPSPPPLSRTHVSPRVAPIPAVSDRERIAPAMSAPTDDLELLLRRIIREEAGVTPVAPAPKWRGGTVVLKPAAGQEKSWPIDTLFHKIVMIRNRLRTLEQQVNASDLPADAKLKLQSYVTGCYGSLTSFNVLFADEADQFKGTGGDE
jgi:hypothetical protein